tara:strand:+ start:42 stop:635 length:594 start_codon:yes stop_codon:yes gene_type:complete
MSFEIWILLGIVLLFLIYLLSIYNRMIQLKNRVDNSWSQIDVQLQRRYDLIPNLIETVKKSMLHEHETLQMVVEARNAAQKASHEVFNSPSNSAAMAELTLQEEKLQGAINNFRIVAEAYPDLRSNTNLLSMQEELASTENKVGFARQGFNDAVMSYNIGIESFPNSIIANYCNLSQASMWEIESPEARKPVKVAFD